MQILIEWTLIGVIKWILERSPLFLFYELLGLYPLYKYTQIMGFNKAVIYTLSFLLLVVGVWEMPLFIYGAQEGLIWIAWLISYMIPFPIICILFQITFHFKKRDFYDFIFWCAIASAFTGIHMMMYASYPFWWNWGISYIFRTFTAIMLYRILRPIKVNRR